MIEYVNTGVMFKGYPILLGPRKIDNNIADKLVLTQLDRFLRKHFPTLVALVVSDDEAFVKGAFPPKTKGETK